MVTAAPGRFVVPPGFDGETLRQAIGKAIEFTSAHTSERATVELAAGVHRIDIRDGHEYAIDIRGAARIDVIGEDAELNFVDPLRGGIRLTNTQDISLRGLTIDYASPPFSQGIITAVDAQSGTLWFTPAEGYPGLSDRMMFVGSGYGTLRDGATGRLKPSCRQTFMISYDATPARDGTFAIRVEPDSMPWFDDIEVGDGFVTGYRGDHHGIALDGCDDTVIENVLIHTAPCAGILSDQSNGTVLNHVVVARRPGTSRWISTNADAFHCQGGRRGPQILHCRFESMQDDGINLYVLAARVVEFSDGFAVLECASPPRAGDALQFVDGSTGTVVLETVATEVDDLGSNRSLIHIKDAQADVVAGLEVYNRSNCSPGFVIEHCEFSNFRGIGIRLKASNGTISHNVFTDLSGCGIWMANDPGWSEGPLGSLDVLITDNTFSGVPSDTSLQSWPHSAATIMIETFTNSLMPGASTPHTNIRIEQNHIEQLANAAVFIGSAVNISVDGLKVPSIEGQPRPAVVRRD